MIDHAIVAAGDVIEMPSGTLRIVRSVSRHSPRSNCGRLRRKPEETTNCYFAIRHCSWTHRPYTLYSVGEMNRTGWKPTCMKMPLDSEFDKKLLSDMVPSKSLEELNFHCCDIAGVA